MTENLFAAVLWPHFILAAALGHVAKVYVPSSDSEPFCYMDTHAGTGRLPLASADISPLWRRRRAFANSLYCDALHGLPADGEYPGSWVLAARVLANITAITDEFEVDVNDIDPLTAAHINSNREQGRLRVWNHDWFAFLRTRLSMRKSTGFVFIDPPPDDPRGPNYAVDAALLLDTLTIPYLVTYRGRAPQDVIDMVGRTVLECDGVVGAVGVILGGGAQAVLLSILPDLRELAGILGGRLSVRTPVNEDFTI